jgi:hypothetical protein
MLAGYKTYVTAAVAVVTALGAWLVGEADLAATIQLIFTALMAAFLRSGLAAGLQPKDPS